MDLTIIESALGLASTALTATGKAVTTVEGIKKLLKAEKKPETGEAAELLNTLATELTAANMMNLKLSEALRHISHEFRRIDEFEKEKARYELFQTGQNDMVFRLKADAANGQPDHFICPVCLNKDKLFSYLSGRGDYRSCQTNTNHLFTFSKTSYPSRGGDWT